MARVPQLHRTPSKLGPNNDAVAPQQRIIHNATTTPSHRNNASFITQQRRSRTATTPQSYRNFQFSARPEGALAQPVGARIFN